MKNRKPLLASLLAATILITSAPLGILAPASAAEVQNDYELIYSLNKNGNFFDGTCTVDRYTGTPVDVVIPETSPYGDRVTAIGRNAFSNCSSLTSITIPASVTSIGDWAFQDCSSLTNITISEGVTEIGSYAFSGCPSLTNITIPASVTSIGDRAFEDCSSLTKIDVADGNKNYSSQDGVLFDKNKSEIICYLNGKPDTEYTIPKGVTEIGRHAFSGCSNLTNITIPEGVTEIGYGAFSGCSSLTNITIPESVTEIGDFAFSGCSNLTNITIHKGVTEIGRYAFSSCSSLTDITIPEGVISIGERTFSGCSNLTNITIPESVISIGDGAFSGCSGLTNITILEGVTEIGGSAFENCSSLTNITVPESVTEIGRDVFSRCHSLKEISVVDGNKNYSSQDGVLFDKNKSEIICYPNGKTDTEYAIPEGVRTTDWDAFLDCDNLRNIIFPESFTSINVGAFASCDNLTSIIIPQNVTYIGQSAFQSCSNLTNVTILGSVITIEWYAFEYCDNLTNITILSPNTSFGYYNSVLPTSTTIHGYTDSTAEAYAFNNGNPFVPLDETNKFSSPEISKDQAEDGTPVNAIAVEEGELAAYANNRAHEDGSFDLRIILAENAVIQNGEKLTLSFYRDGSPEAYIISRTVADEYVAGKTAKTYDQVIAAGETYAASGSGTLFGFVVTGIPAGGFDSATLTVTAADGSVIAATQFAYATVAPQA